MDKNKKTKAKGWVKKNWPKLAVGAAAAVGTGVAVALGVKHLRPKNVIWMPGFTIDGPLTVADLGKLGEEYLKNDPGLTPETIVREVGVIRFD